MEIPLEIKWHGPIEQGAMSFASLLAKLLAMQGKFVQVFPSYGDEWEKCCGFGAAYNRISNSPIKRHSRISAADVCIIMDLSPFLNSNFSAMNMNDNTKENGCFVINTPFSSEWCKEKFNFSSNSIFSLDVLGIAKQEMLTCDAFFILLGVVTQKVIGIDMGVFRQDMGELLSKGYDSNTVRDMLTAVEIGIHEAGRIERHLRIYNE